jgi:intein/homing endonuclease
LARIAGHVVGDGGINSNLIVHYTNEKSELLDIFRKCILETFGEVKYGFYAHKNKEHIKTVWFPRIVGLLLAKMIGKQVKKYKHVPKIILEADNNLKSIFLGALFDDEGRVSVDAYTISIIMTGKKLVKDVKKLLEEIGISCGKISVIEPDEFSFGKKYKMRLGYQFYISGKISLKRFSELINFENFPFLRYDISCLRIGRRFQND